MSHHKRCTYTDSFLFMSGITKHRVPELNIQASLYILFKVPGKLKLKCKGSILKFLHSLALINKYFFTLHFYLIALNKTIMQLEVDWNFPERISLFTTTANKLIRKWEFCFTIIIAEKFALTVNRRISSRLQVVTGTRSTWQRQPWQHKTAAAMSSRQRKPVETCGGL